MNAQQLHQLDMLIAKAMGKNARVFSFGDENCSNFQPTRNPADAMEVLGWVVRDWFGTISVGTTADGNFFICGEAGSVESKTLPLAICLFAEKIININPTNNP